MPLTVSNNTGDGVKSSLIQASIELPDAGTSVNVSGSVNGVIGGTPLGPKAITGSPLTAPSAPGSGSIFWNIQVDATSGAATVQQSTVSDPAPINGNNLVIFRQTLTVGQSDDATVPTDQTPDSN